jgi:tripartite-type tricarboxylate transporter receptor subunit TctC
MAGRINLLFDTLDALPLMRAGSIKAYAVTGETRSVLAPDVPTFREVGFPMLTWLAWLGFFAPKATPTDIIGRLNAAVIDTLADQEVRSRLIELGLEVFPRERQTPETLGALVKADAERTWPIIKAAGIKPE